MRKPKIAQNMDHAMLCVISRSESVFLNDTIYDVSMIIPIMSVAQKVHLRGVPLVNLRLV